MKENSTRMTHQKWCIVQLEVAEDFGSDDWFVALTSIVVNSIGDESDWSSVPDAGSAKNEISYAYSITREEWRTLFDQP